MCCNSNQFSLRVRWFWYPAEPWYNKWHVSLTPICLYLFTNWHSFIFAINVRTNSNILPCGTDIDLYSEGLVWDNVYSETFCVPTSSCVPAVRPDHDTNVVYFIISHPTIQRYSFIHDATALPIPVPLLTVTSRSHADT